MPDVTRTIKLLIHTDPEGDRLFKELTEQYRCACNHISQYIFDNGFVLNFMDIQSKIYPDIRGDHGLKSQMAISSIKTVTARYKSVKEQLSQNPYKYKDEEGKYHYITKTLEWLWKPVSFRRPQADLVRGRDYSFIEGGKRISVNTLGKRVKVTYELPKFYKEYLDGTWSFGVAKLVRLKKNWYLHIPMTKTIPGTDADEKPVHVVGMDRGLRFLMTSYDEKGKCEFY